MFAKEFKSALKQIDSDIMRSFPNFRNGTGILQEVLTELILIYERFLTILKTPPFKRPDGWPDVVDVHQLMVEVKRYKSAF